MDWELLDNPDPNTNCEVSIKRLRLPNTESQKDEWYQTQLDPRLDSNPLADAEDQ